MRKFPDDILTLQWVILGALLSMFLFWLIQSNCCSQLATVGAIVPSAIVLAYLAGILSVNTLRTMRPKRPDPHTVSIYLILAATVTSLSTLIIYALSRASVPFTLAGLSALILFSGGFWGLARHEMRAPSSDANGNEEPTPGRSIIGLVVAYFGFVLAGYGLVARLL